jgi:hypothetical protein
MMSVTFKSLMMSDIILTVLCRFTEVFYAECLLSLASFFLSVKMPSVVLLSVFYAECHYVECR